MGRGILGLIRASLPKPRICAVSGTSPVWRLLVQLDHLRLADHSHERSDPLRQLRSDVACWSTAATRAIRIRRA